MKPGLFGQSDSYSIENLFVQMVYEEANLGSALQIQMNCHCRSLLPAILKQATATKNSRNATPEILGVNNLYVLSSFLLVTLPLFPAICFSHDICEASTRICS